MWEFRKAKREVQKALKAWYRIDVNNINHISTKPVKSLKVTSISHRLGSLIDWRIPCF